MRVLTYNIHKLKGSLLRRTTLGALAREIGERGADLVLCQEVFHGLPTAQISQSEELAAALGLRFSYGANARYRRGHHGNATFSTLPIIGEENHDLSTNSVERRGVLYTRFELGDGHIHVFNTHLGLNQRQRQRQIVRIGELMRDVADDGHPLILAGDFNDWTGRLDALVKQECDLASALDLLGPRDRRSFPAEAPIFPLDRIYYRGFDLGAARVLRSAPWHGLSDHLPIEAEFHRDGRPVLDLRSLRAD